MGKAAYYIFVFPLSLLPMAILYRFSDLLYFLFITIIPYRSKVITSNIKRSFPTKNEREVKELRKKFYRHFCDLLIEGVKNLSIPERQLKKRLVVTNPEIMNQLSEQGKSVLLLGGHYGNWEWLITSQNTLFPHQAYGIGKKLTSKFWDKKLNERRERFGMRVINNKNYKEVLNANQNECKAILVLTDQSPGSSIRSFWTQFLQQETAVLFGAEMLAHELDYALVYFKMQKAKRGHYEIVLELITDKPRTMGWGKITKAHVERLEEQIKLRPELWLWSHKRWKRELPEDLESLKEEQNEKFNKRFGY
jgi:KDO2-lipid IV(A) lauroyltransferase